MTKKSLLLVIVVAVFLLLPGVHVYAVPENVPLELGGVDPSNNGQGNPGRSPVFIPSVSIDGSTIYFITPCDGCLLRIVDEFDNEVYSTVIPVGATSLVLPAYLSGDYELQIVTGIYYFYGDITL